MKPQQLPEAHGLLKNNSAAFRETKSSLVGQQNQFLKTFID